MGHCFLEELAKNLQSNFLQSTSNPMKCPLFPFPEMNLIRAPARLWKHGWLVTPPSPQATFPYWSVYCFHWENTVNPPMSETNPSSRDQTPLLLFKWEMKPACHLAFWQRNTYFFKNTHILGWVNSLDHFVPCCRGGGGARIAFNGTGLGKNSASVILVWNEYFMSFRHTHWNQMSIRWLWWI